MLAQEEYMDKGRFLYGESMGGAVTLLLHKKDPSFWNGAILVAPMCKVKTVKVKTPQLKSLGEMKCRYMSCMNADI